MKLPRTYIAIYLVLILTYVISTRDSIASENDPIFTISVVMEVGSISQMEVLEAFQHDLSIKQLPKSSLQKIYVTKHDDTIGSSQINALNESDIVIAIGTEASKLLSKSSFDTPVLNIFLPRTAYRMHWEGAGKKTGAIFLEQAPERYVRMTKALLPDARKVSGFMEYDRVVVNMFKTSFAEKHIKFDAFDLTSDNFIKNLKASLEDTDLLLIPAGHPALTPHRARWLLYMAYRKKVPVIAYSEQFVDAGALASIYSTPPQIGKQAAELIEKMLSRHELSKSPLPSTVYPEYFMVETNRKVTEAYLHKFVNENDLINDM